MSAIPSERDASWRAPGVDAEASPLVEALLGRLGGVLDELGELSLGALGDAVGARHIHQWWAGRSRHTHADAAWLSRLARAFEDDLHAPTASALAAGGLRVEQGRVIVAAVDAIPASVRAPDGVTRIVGLGVRAQARDHLLAAAAEHDAKALRRLGRRILEVVAPSSARRKRPRRWRRRRLARMRPPSSS